MKYCFILLMLGAIFGCSNSETESKNASPKDMRNRNLALAYIDSGMMAEASHKLTLLENALPDEAFVYANQGLIELRQNNLDKAESLLKKANSLAPTHPKISLLRSEIAMLAGKFDLAKAIIEKAIQAHPKDMQLRWALSDSKEHLQVIVDEYPKNIVARLALIKELLKEQQFDKAKMHLIVLKEQGAVKDDQAIGLYNSALKQIADAKARVARAQVIGLDNVLKPTRAWQHSLLEVAGPPGTIGQPIRTFINTSITNEKKTFEKDVSFTKDNESIKKPNKKHVVIVESTEQIEVVVVDDYFAFTAIPIDWNNDRKTDVMYGTTKGDVAIQGGNILLDGNGETVIDLTPWDADQDGDLDVLVTRDNTLLLQNNGDGTTSIIELDTPRLRSTHIIDIDEDGAVDVVGFDSNGKLVLLKNERSGNIHAVKNILPSVISDLTVGDFNNDGWMDIAYLANGSAWIAENDHRGGFLTRRIGGFGLTIETADIDNDTKLDLLLGGEQLEIHFANGIIKTVDAPGTVQVVDADLDGDLDLAISGTEFAIWQQDGTPRDNEYQKIILEAILEGGQRNNALAVGGFVEVKSGHNYQKHLVTGPLTHIGLGGQPADAIRVVWPNGVPQEVIEPVPNQVFTEMQILKGSCPFLATRTKDGSWEFVTDLLWRSPLGLKINAQTVPPIAATQDWVKIQSDQLHPRNGIYELAVTAQLWETHFIDEINMIAIDHPIGTEIFVDERFVAPIPPAYKLYAYESIHTPLSAIDQNGADVIEILRNRDSKRLGDFEKGPYQGVGTDHYIELELGNIDPKNSVDIIAQGWVRPTDTSINVASAQNKNAPIPSGIRVEVPDGKGNWKPVIPNGGFPAGKLKTIILEIPPDSFVDDDYRIRIATNLEIYWDKISYAVDACSDIISTSVELRSADLGYMGFPNMSRTNKNAPNIPDYNDIHHGNAWRDLEGYYTRYGSVEELLQVVDDRYVIMNAGDAMWLQFEELNPPANGYIRDYIFFSDGWVKDGDWNTVDSKTVGPLPFHSMSGYPYPLEELPKTLLPASKDWQEYHTRYITPSKFRDAFKPK